MKKVFAGIFGLVLVVGMVAGAAYALFSDTVTVSGITFATGTADLQIAVTGDTWEESAPLNLTVNLVPGKSQSATFKLKNNSSNPDLDMVIKARLTSAQTDWNALKDYIEIIVLSTDPAAETGWKTLAEWNAAEGIELPGGLLDQGTEETYQVLVRLQSGAPNTLQNKSVTDIIFVITGTQVQY